MNRSRVEKEIWQIVNAAGGEYEIGETEVHQLVELIEEYIEKCAKIAEDDTISWDQVVGHRIATAIREQVKV